MKKSKLSLEERETVYEFKNLLSNASMSTLPISNLKKNEIVRNNQCKNLYNKTSTLKFVNNDILENIKKTAVNKLIHFTLYITFAFIRYNK
ncbi:Us8.5 homologue [Phocid alphaherpesvirus 1]|uniref:Us8.5 homologue n=1 Tax=Phocid alphaherpesvirus 1 TaxID=47418 RepID=Q91E37_9ALPH|nr:Us8.5 homologue [Phocid alphaherpesvirus 1]YP_010794898.1 Us8.5-like protein [Phocid alphaherpesvirus 1]QBN85186.1 Us8.5-like protein [Phocid alphaherpesvirus 1]UNP64302.1 US8.5-like protein [Phocid alphaherpesvirus 1]CAC51468.1 Us8.5 homologue [Phocid alphaherpesvirus 1]